MKQVLAISLICALMITAQTADYVQVKIECKANESCESNFEYVYSKGTNVSQTVCAETACEPHSFEVEAIKCEKDYTGQDCESQYCIADYSFCLDKDTACSSTGNTTTECKACSTEGKCSDDTSVKGNCGWASDGTQASCITTEDCPFSIMGIQAKNCQTGTSGDACSCCGIYKFEDLQSSGICLTTQLMPWYSDEFEKAFAAEDENSIARQLTQLAFLCIVGLFLSFNTL